MPGAVDGVLARRLSEYAARALIDYGRAKSVTVKLPPGLVEELRARGYRISEVVRGLLYLLARDAGRLAWAVADPDEVVAVRLEEVRRRLDEAVRRLSREVGRDGVRDTDAEVMAPGGGSGGGGGHGRG